MLRKPLTIALAMAACAGGAAGGAIAAAAASSASTVIATATLGQPRALPPGYFGINYDYGGASVYLSDRDVAGQLTALAPGTLRWPAGTGANYFQWQQGYPVSAGPATRGGGSCASPGEGEADGFRFTLGDLAAAYHRSRATPIFDLNVMTATLASQLQLLRTARDQYGLPIRYVELGNEFYLCTADYVTAFPTVRDYANTVSADVKALHNAFPGVRVAAVGALPHNSPRSAGWNTGLLSDVTGAGKPDAITLHDHPEYPRGLTTAGLPSLFELAYSSASNVTSVSRRLGHVPVWITEYGLSLKADTGRPAQLTYANALFESAAAILLEQDVSDATLIDYWSSFGPAVNYAYTKNGLTPAGMAMQWLDEAAQGAQAAVPVEFSGGPVIGSSSDSALVGDVFLADRRQRAILLNLGGSAVSIAAGRVIPPGAHYQQATGNPLGETGTAGGLTTTNGTVGRSLTLAPYSMTVVSGGYRI
jgi:hypothetical protein